MIKDVVLLRGEKERKQGRYCNASSLCHKNKLERAVVELVYKFDEKSTTSVCKGKSKSTVSFLGGHIHINGHQPRSYIPRLCCACGVNNGLKTDKYMMQSLYSVQ